MDIFLLPKALVSFACFFLRGFAGQVLVWE